MVQEHMYVFQERQNVLEHIKISRRAFPKFCKNRSYPRPYPKNRCFVKLPRRMLSNSVTYHKTKQTVIPISFIGLISHPHILRMLMNVYVYKSINKNTLNSVPLFVHVYVFLKY